MKLSEFRKCYGTDASNLVEKLLKMRHKRLTIVSRNSQKIPFPLRADLHGLDDSNRVVIFEGPKSKFIIDYDKYFGKLKAIKIHWKSSIDSMIIDFNDINKVLNQI